MMKLSPKVLTGALNQCNKGACDWGWQGFLAHGCQTFVVIIDPKTVQVLQVLEGHKVPVTKLKWSHENYHHDQGSPYTLRLASSDLNGVIISWDVAQADKKAEFSDGNRPVQDLSWVKGHDGCRDLLVALHPPYSLILWNADTGTKLWKKSYTETLISFTFDPFDPKQLAFLGQDCIVFVDDFAVTKLPSSNGNKFYISSPSSQGGAIPQSHSSSQLSDKKAASLNLAKRMSRILVGETRPNNNKPEDELVVASDCLQLTYHPACRHHLILLYSREVLILDLAINQTVGIIPMERTGSPFVQVLPCMQRDVLICLHENGSLSLRVRRKTNIITTPASEGSGAFDDTPPHVSLDVAYDLRCQSDAMRLTRHSKVYGVSICPVSERSVSLVMSDSRVIFWDVRVTELLTTQNQLSPLYTPGHSDNSANQNMLPALPDCKLPVISNVKYPRLTLSDFISQSAERQLNKGKPHGVCLKFLLTGLISGISGAVTVIRMCPPLTTKNWSIYQPLLALGTQTGCIQIYNVSSGQLEKEYSIHSSAIRGIEWVTLQSLLTFAYPNPGSSGLVKNEVVLLDVVSGKATPLRGHKDEESPVELIRVSCLRQYFMVCFKDKPFELWDLQNLTLMREMPKHLPRITALEWSPSHALKTLKRRLLQRQETSGQHASDTTGGTMGPPAVTDPSGREGKSHTKSSPKEHFIFTDQEGVVYHVIVEGNLITDCSKIPPEPGMSTINSIAWKGDIILYGDVDGHLNIWDLKSKKSKYLQTHRGWVKKVRFAPGRGNMKFLVLYNSGLDVWDAGEVQCLYSLKYPKDICKVIDAEWTASDKPVVATEDGCVRVMDIKLTKATAPVDERFLGEDIFCPHLLPPKASLSLKYLLSHQPWNEGFLLKLDNMLDCDRDLESGVNAQMAILNKEISEYLPHCMFGTAHRCLMVARLFGDEADLHFWTVALHYLRSERHSPMSKSPSRVSQSDTSLFIPTTPVLESTDLVRLDPVTSTETVTSVFTDQPLDRCYDVLCDHKSFQKYQLDRLALHDSKRATYEHTKKCAENCMLLGQTDRAVQLLLETEPENDGYYIDSLRACLVASIRSSGASQSTIKLVATNLIANGKLSEGVQLLCLIDKGLDACRYLQTYGEWQQAAWLAKATLDYTEYSEVMKRWADHLCSSHANQKSKALLALLSLGQFVKVIEMLYTMRHFDTATCFVEACLEFGLLDVNEETKRLIDAVYLEYARYLTNLGNRKASEYYCHLAGDNGSQFLKEIEILFS